MRRLVLATIILAAGGYTACVIGPKQDDPATTSLGNAPDASAALDTGGGGGGGETAGPPATDAGDRGDVGTVPMSDASATDARDDAGDSQVDAPSDALADAPLDTTLDAAGD